ncbi:nitrous oxide reductase accessory protein NosL [Maribacter sp. PR1]|uniref:Nitrous oxide reductase accessory protein NosL n=1 Tax=Maribacter cobaltidurans TaxID=1178778 RepID=A0ABU7IYF9_9FLAO|nr:MULTISPECIES: nitrous oxide reductase accessory protein NosL [Maribacter]MDC6390442.1 nitrous oxide reductase accessory protein NosL [Maribacter sp. PR1]MEE1977831.1 nitrous oxide reductase accessory protein NosL [Maribacter cobaltidurans]
MKKNIIFFVFFTIILSSCNNVPKPILYGSDSCHYCSMTIVDKQHAAQFMTKKGRSYSFDASECMLNYLKEIDKTTVATFLVNDYNKPGETIDATKATYLISKNIPSPMGAYLSAFANKEVAQYVKEKNEGELLTWEELRNRFK